MKKEFDDAEKAGGGGANRFNAARGGMRNPADVNFQNMSEEEKEEEWKRKWQLPKPFESKSEYEERIAKNKGINNNSIYIIEGIENIQSVMEEDRKQWQASDEFRHLYNIRSERGIKRILLGNRDHLDSDPVQRYKESIDSLTDILSDIRNKAA